MIKIALVAGALVSGFALSASAAPAFIGKAAGVQASAGIEQVREAGSQRQRGKRAAVEQQQDNGIVTVREGAASNRQRGGKRGGASLEQPEDQKNGGIILVREGNASGGKRAHRP